ncbi:MAG: phosphoadenylyl-sulfate reductase [Verrucomicrobia bacterium]|nr:phosphoadenylyl-sulfate reductase [Verrucomicrobiota bacterium]
MGTTTTPAPSAVALPILADAGIDYHGDGSAEDILRWGLERYHPRITLSTSFKDGVLIHMLSQIRADFRVFALDTGRLNEETYELAEELRRRYGIQTEWIFPRHEGVEKLERGKGLFSFRDSLENRRECCYIRKVEPLSRALEGLDAWITGVRRDQGVTREGSHKIERDQVHGGIIKLNPLADWDQDRMWAYIRANKIPYNRLYDKGYTSIGCAPCTRPVPAGEDPRSGRWWWELAEHKECGIHVQDWSI